MEPPLTETIIDLMESVLTPDLLSKAERDIPKGAHPTTGHCAVAAEALFFLLGGKPYGYKAMVATYYVDGERCTHWWIVNKDGDILDPTAKQFTGTPPYHLGKGTGFQGIRYNDYGPVPSKRARILLNRLYEKYGYEDPSITN
jgi:hypothetical protein